MKRLTLKNLIQLITLNTIVLGSTAVLAKESVNLAKANEQYLAGNCARAVELYTAAQSEPNLGTADVSQILFKRSYCQLNLGNNAEAESGFIAYLSKDPTHAEATVRLAEAQLNLGAYNRAKLTANKVPPGDFKPEAVVIAARAAMDSGETTESIKILNSYQEPGSWKSAFLYWKGVAHYKNDERSLALKAFQNAKLSSTPDSWVISESQAWIERIGSDDKLFGGSLTLGYLSDSNVAQSATTNVAGGGANPGEPGGGKKGELISVGDSSTIKDSGYYLSGELKLTPYNRNTKNISASLSYSSPYYSKSSNSSYNYRVYTFEVGGNFKTSGGDWWGIKAQSLKTYYDTTESEGYTVLSPYYYLNITNSWNFRFDYSYSKYTKTTGSSTHSASASTYYGFTNNLGVRSSLSYTKGVGEKAVYIGTTNPPTITSGSAFSNYATMGLSIGFWSRILSKLEGGLTGSYYKTTYAHESAPTPTGVNEPSDRVDSLTQYSAYLSYPLIENRWTLDFSGTISKNSSTGYQGLPTYGSLTTYTYERSYSMLSTSFYF